MHPNRSMTFLTILAASVLVALVLEAISCQQVQPSEPYSHHFDPYSYGYESEDNYGNKQWKQERSNHPHEVHGSYGYRDNHGVYREVTYVADQNGFRANIKSNEPGMSDKAPASTKMESHYAPAPVQPQAAYTAHPSSSQHYAPAPTSHHQHQQSAPASPPVYVRQHYAPSQSYYQSAV